MTISVDEALDRAGTGPFQRRLLGIFGLVWTADAMQVLAVGFTAATIASSFGLTVPEALQTGTLFFLGMMIGATVFGRIADKIGRRNVLLITVAFDAIFGIASAFAPNFEFLLVARLLTGIAVGGTLPVDYAMMSEFLPSKNRGRWLVMLEGFWAVGTVLVALVAWGAATYSNIEPWRVIFFATAIPAILGFGLRFLIPESPLYLLRNGNAEQAKSVLNQVLLKNGKEQIPASVKLEQPATTKHISIFSPQLLRRSLLIMALWFLVSVSYYGIFTWLPAHLAGEGFGFVRGYGFLVVVALAQIPGYILAAYGVEKWGRRPTLISFLFLSAAGCFLFVVASNDIAIATAILLMSFALLGTWGALYAFTPELYPTSSRATGMGVAGAMARLGGLLAPSVMAFVITQSLTAAVSLFAAFLLIGAVAAYFINVETRAQSIA